MSQGKILRLSGSFLDDSLPRYYPNDSTIDAGTEFIFDASKVISWPSQSSPNNGDTIFNLVNGKPHAEIAKTTGIGFRNGGFDFLGISASNYINTGGASDYRLGSLGNPDFVYITWFKRETGFSNNSYQNIIGRGSNTQAANLSYVLNLGPNGDEIWAQASSGTVAKTVAVRPTNEDYVAIWGEKLNSTVQVAFAVEQGQLLLFIDGVLVRSIAFEKPYNDLSAQPTSRIISGASLGGNPFKGILKRWAMHKLGFGVNAQQKVTKDYNDNNSRLKL